MRQCRLGRRKKARGWGLVRLGLLVLVSVLLIEHARPAFAGFCPRVCAIEKSSFAPQAIFIPIGDPAETMVVDTNSLTGGNRAQRNFRLHIRSKLLTADNVLKCLDERPLDIESEISASENLSSNFDFCGGRSSKIEAHQRSPEAVYNVRFALRHGFEGNAFPSGSVNPDLRPMRSVKFLPREPDALASQSRLFVRGNPKSESETSNRDSSEGREKPVMLINQSQRASRLRADGSDELGLVVGVFGGIFSALVAYAGLKRVCELVFGPNKYA